MDRIKKHDKMLLLGGLLFFCSSIVYADTALKVTDQNESNADAKNYLSYQMHYPVFSQAGKDLNLLNRAVLKQAQSLLIQFSQNLQPKDQLEQMSKKIKMIPLNEQSNTVDIEYKILLNTEHFVSVRFESDYYYYGAAHPDTLFTSVVFDLDHQRTVKLSDLFNPNLDYLDLLSKMLSDSLTNKLLKNDESGNANLIRQQIITGTAAIDSNFQIWNLTEKGILWTFPPYQVAAYVYGPQEVEIPYDKLKPYVIATYLPQNKTA